MKARLPVRHLQRFWSARVANAAEGGRDWVADNTLLNGLRLGLRETFDFLYQKRPSLAEFEEWILQKNGGAIDPARIDRLNTALSDAGVLGEPADPHAEPVLTASDLAFWDENGYVVLRDAVPPENCRAAVGAICEFLDVQLDRPETWYGGPQVPQYLDPSVAPPRAVGESGYPSCTPRVRAAVAP